jgi:hypothetical protein
MSKSSDTMFSSQNNRVSKFTPRELIRYHIEHPEIPITDKDIENLVLDFPIVSDKGEGYQSFNKNNNNNFSNNNFTEQMLF